MRLRTPTTVEAGGITLRFVRGSRATGPRALAVAASLAATLACSTARGAEPVCDFLSGIADAAQAQAEDSLASAEAAARRAVAAAHRGDSGARAQLALGLALAAEGRAVDALASLDAGLPAAAGPAHAEASLARAEALLAAGRPAEAAAAFHAVAAEPATPAARRAAWREPDALIAAGRPAEAIPVLEALLATAPQDPPAAAARLSLAGARRATGDAAGAVAAYRALWLDAPAIPEAASAELALARWREGGGPVPAPSGEDLVARAERLLVDARPAEALAELDRTASAGPPAASPPRLAALRALALLNQGRTAEADALARPLLSGAPPAEERLAAWVAARAAARAGKRDEAAALYARVAAATAPVPGLPEWHVRDLSDESAYLAAWLPYDAGDFGRAVRQLDAFARAHPRSRRVDDARWFAAWARVRLGRTAEAAAAFARLGRHGALADGARYWEARFSPAPRRPALYREAIAAAPQGWYALLARARLRALRAETPPVTAPEPRSLPEPSGEAAARLAGAADLLALGLRRAALAELDDLARSGRGRPVASLVAQLAAFAADAELPFRMARDLLLPTRRALRWAHPEPSRPDAISRARALGLDPSLLLAVMRRESGFRADVRSSAAAEGLLQLIGPTADRLASLLGVAPEEARLHEPEVNVTLGAWYLALLTSRFGDPALAVASYNAGPRPVSTWATAAEGTPLDLFVERIPFRETRQYVRIVLADWAVYRELAGEPPPAIDPDRRVEAPPPGIAF
jgi:soluble lytic murein transglycosylase